MDQEFFKIFQKIANKNNISRQIEASQICHITNKILADMKIVGTATKFQKHLIWIQVSNSVTAHQVHSQKSQVISKIKNHFPQRIELDLKTVIKVD